jgi:hypothetical protein
MSGSWFPAGFFTGVRMAMPAPSERLSASVGIPKGGSEAEGWQGVPADGDQVVGRAGLGGADPQREPAPARRCRPKAQPGDR